EHHHRRRRHGERAARRPGAAGGSRQPAAGGLHQSRRACTARREPAAGDRLLGRAATGHGRHERPRHHRAGLGGRLERERGGRADQHDRDAARLRDELQGDLHHRPDAPVPQQQRVRWMMRKLIFPAVLLLAGCAGVPDTPPEFEPTLPEAWNEPVTPTGGIFHVGREIALFQDRTASRPGDILTKRLVEKTTAQRSASTSTSKATSGSSDFPTVFGRPVTRNGIAILSSEYESSREFSGEGDSSQSNRLEGEITVTVAERLANGNLVVRDRKSVV